MSFLNKITKYFLVEFIKIFLLILFSIALLIFIVDFLEFLPKMEKNSIPSLIAIKIVLFAIPNMLEEFFQFIVLIAVVFTMTKIASKNELTVVYSSGYSAWKVLKIYSIFIFFFGLFSIFCLNLIFTNMKRESIFLENKFTKNENKYFLESRNGLWLKQIDMNVKETEILIRADKVYLDELNFVNCILLFFYNSDFVERYNAESMKLTDGFWILKNVYIFRENKDLEFKEEIIIPTAISFDFIKQQIQNRYENLDLIPFFSLNKLIKDFKISGLDTYKFIAKKNILFMTPFIYVLMVMLGILFSNNYQRNTKNIINIFKAVVCGICIFVVQNTLFELALANKINLLFATWGFFGVLFLIVMILLMKKIELQNV